MVKGETLRWLAGRGVWLKSCLMVALLFAVGGVCAVEPTISVTATPRYPWNGVVDVQFTIGADEAEGGYAEVQPGDEAIAGRRLKYVRSVGDAQLNTGVVPGSKNTIELKFAWEDNPEKVNECLFCARGSSASTATFTGFLINGRWRFDYNATTGSTNGVPLATKGVPIVIRDVAGTVSVDGITRQSHSATSFTVGGPLTLFASYVGTPETSTDNFLKGKIYYFKVFGDDGTTLLHDFVPWEKDGVAGMYDMIAKRFVAPNVGTLTGGTKYDTSFTAKDVAGGTNLTMKTLYKSNGAAANAGMEQLLPGMYNWVWDATMDLTSRWPSHAGCVPTNSAVLFKDTQLASIVEFYAVPCGTPGIFNKSNRVRDSLIKSDGAGKSVQFAFSDDKYTKCVCVHFEQSGADVIGYVKWARYVTGLGRESEDFETNSATTQTIATSETTGGYGLCKIEARIPQPDVSVVLDRVVVEGNVNASVYYVKFNANGGTGTMANESFTYGTAKALTANAFTRTGYTFDGWATSASGAKVYSNKQSVSNLTTTANGTYNLYACWKGNSYSVKFNANGGTGTMSNESFTYGTAKALTANAFTRTGFTFDGWAKSASGAKAYSNKQSVSNLTATAGGTFNLYAVWKATGGVQLWANGPYWAECNVGATKPEEYGYYFWWGDTVGYKRNASNNGWVSVKNGASFSFTSGNCPTCYKTAAQLTSAGYIGSSGNLVAKYDAATVQLGAPWRMPTYAEFNALISNCSMSYTTRNGIHGLLFKGRGDHSSKSIFFPCAGYGASSSLVVSNSYASYWASTPYFDSYDPDCCAWIMYYNSQYGLYYSDRYYGRSARPVR